MPSQLNLPHSLLKLPLALCVKETTIPAHPVDELGIDVTKPVVYVLPFDSRIDLLTLQKQALRLGLPDPLTPLELGGQKLQRYVFISDSSAKSARGHNGTAKSINLFSHLLEWHKQYPSLDVQVVPITILWGRKPGKEANSRPYLEALSTWKKTQAVLTSGRDCLVQVSSPVSMRYMADSHGTDNKIAHKLARVARIHFSRKKLAASGPRLPVRQELCQRLVSSETIVTAISDYARANKITEAQAEAEAHKILNEIAADFSYSLIKKGERVLRWLWNRIYQGITVSNAATVRQLAQEGHELVYVPCHRSHMDYLLLSYVLYQEGMVPPHIAAGINLNFFPAGPIFRKGGAFFLRRTFKGNKLYSTIFREYLAELFAKGYSIEYFSEGGRSRTGRLLEAKTGMLAMTIQAMRRGLPRPVTLVPVYIGYEHVMEVSTYAKELRGKNKEKENVSLVIKTIKKLRNFGRGYVSFGEPIPLNTYLNEQVPDWASPKLDSQSDKPTWISPVVGQLANKMMTHINDAAAVNALTLCATALLASKQRALSRHRLITQINCYLSLFKQIPYSSVCTIPEESAEQLLAHAESLNKFVIEPDSLGDIVSLDRHQAILMTYYRNNIIHLLALPSLIAQLIVHKKTLSTQDLLTHVQALYPFLQKELFLSTDLDQLEGKVLSYLSELTAQNLVIVEGNIISVNQANSLPLILLGRTISETMQRYTIALSLLVAHPLAGKSELEKMSQEIAQRLGRLHGVNAPEFFDKKVFATMFTSLKQQQYIKPCHEADLEQCQNLATLLHSTLDAEVSLTIRESVCQASLANDDATHQS